MEIAVQVVLVADLEPLDGLVVLRVAEHLHEELILQLLPPALAGLVGVGGVVEQVGVVDVGLVGLEVEPFVEQGVDRLEALVEPLEEAIEDLLGEGKLAAADLVVELVLERLELGDVVLGEEELGAVQGLDVALVPLLRDLVADLGLGEVGPFDQFGDDPGGDPIGLRGVDLRGPRPEQGGHANGGRRRTPRAL